MHACAGVCAHTRVHVCASSCECTHTNSLSGHKQNLAVGIVFVQSQEVGLEFMKLSETHANQLQMKGIVSSTWPIVLVLQLVRTERIKPVLSSFKYA